jgi:TolB-like protein/class 3 adenylate cyclase/tetratricopeptide (TPR) repeat protein
LERRLAAILAADVAGYTRLMGLDEAGTLRRLTRLREQVLQPLIREHHGRIVKLMGDGLLVEFASAVDAVTCAFAWQRNVIVHEIDEDLETQFRFRIGINLGDVIVEGGDIHGDGVNIAARLEGLAQPGGICLSDDVYRHAKGKIEAQFEDIGEQKLKNVADPVRVYNVVVEPSVAKAPTSVTEPLPLPDKPSIAVLPFQNMSGDAEQEYFADGMVEDIITALSRFHGLFVIARNSSFAYKGQSLDMKQIGRELGVCYVLEGSVRKSGNRVRITGQLIDAGTGAHIWADRFDGGLEDVFDLQDEVTATVVGAIAPKLERAEIERSARKPTESLGAYDYYLRGMAAMHLLSREGSDEALAHFGQAIQLDPSFAAAHGMAARCYTMRKMARWMKDAAQEGVEAVRLARRAVELGPDDEVALCTAAFALNDFASEFAVANTLTERALALNPNLAWAWLFSGWVKVSLGDTELAIERLERAMRLSPQDPQIYSMQSAIAIAHFVASRYAEALSMAETAMCERPNVVLPICVAAASAALAGRVDEAERLVDRLLQVAPELSASNLKDVFSYLRAEDLERWMAGLRKAGLPE